MDNFSNSFFEKGYGVDPVFICNEQINYIRKKAIMLLDSEKDHTLKPTTLLKDEIMSNIIFSDAFQGVLEQLGPSYKIFLPNFTVRRDVYVNWHTDDQYTSEDGATLPGVIQCNIYLQGNSIERGGGIDVATGTHKLSKPTKADLIQSGDVNYETVLTNCGDLLLFDYRVIHRSTYPTQEPHSEPRLALQWTVCNSLEAALGFMSYLLKRQKEKLHLSDFGDRRPLQYFFDAVNVSYPETFLEASHKLIERNGIIVPSFSQLIEFAA